MTKTRTRSLTPTARTVAAVLVAVALLGVFAAGAVAADGSAASMSLDPDNSTANETDTNDTDDDNGIEERGVDLEIQQPIYVDEQIAESGSADRPVYEVRGEKLTIKPTEFDFSEIVDYGVDTDAGSLSYDSTFDSYELDPEGNEGSFDLYWIVDEEVDDGDGNETTTERVQYVATVQVVDDAQVSVLDSDRYNEMREDQNRWQEHNETLGDIQDENLLLHSIFGTPDKETIQEGMYDTYRDSRDPGQYIMGSYQMIVVALVFSAGGYFLLLQIFGGILPALRELYGRLNRFNENEKYEADIAKRQAEQHKHDRLQIDADIDYQDVPGFTDHDAAAFRDMATTPLELYSYVRGHTPWEKTVRDRLRAMSQCGFAARITDADGNAPDLEADASEDGVVAVQSELADGLANGEYSAEIVSLEDELEPDTTLEDRDDLFSIEDPSETLVADVAADKTIWRTFDLSRADFDPTVFDEPLKTQSLKHIVEKLDPPMEYWDSKEEFGQHLLQVFQFLETQPITDTEGDVRTGLYAINRILQLEQYLADVEGVPGCRSRAESIERALIDYDPTAETDRLVTEVRQGRA